MMKSPETTSPVPSGAAIHTRTLGATQLPLVIEPLCREGRPVPVLTAWIAANHAELRRQLTEHGALLFRGFDVDGAAGLRARGARRRSRPQERLPRHVAAQRAHRLRLLGERAAALLPDPAALRDELHAHSAARGSSSAASSLPRAPAARRRSATSARSTPISTPRCASASVRGACATSATTRAPRAAARFDLWKLKRWDEMFLTTDRAVVEAACAAQRLRAHLAPRRPPAPRQHAARRASSTRRRASPPGSTTARSSTSRRQQASTGESPRASASPAIALLAGFAAAMVRLKERSGPLTIRRCTAPTATARRSPTPTWRACATRSGRTWSSSPGRRATWWRSTTSPSPTGACPTTARARSQWPGLELISGCGDPPRSTADPSLRPPSWRRRLLPMGGFC